MIALKHERPAPPQADTDGDRHDAALAASGDTAAFERLYHRHIARIHSLCRRMIGDADADDAAQDVFVRAWGKLGQFRGDSAFGTWLYRLAVNVILAKRQTIGVRAARTAGGDPNDLPLASRPVRVDLRVDVEAAIGRLPRGARDVFVLHDVEGYTHEEIAELLQVTSGTSKSQLHRARMTLRQYLA